MTMTTHEYTIKSRGTEETAHAESLEDAIEQGRQWLAEGDWGVDGEDWLRTIVEPLRVTRVDDTDEEWSGYVVIDPPEPKCCADDHEWISRGSVAECRICGRAREYWELEVDNGIGVEYSPDVTREHLDRRMTAVEGQIDQWIGDHADEWVDDESTTDALVASALDDSETARDDPTTGWEDEVHELASYCSMIPEWSSWARHDAYLESAIRTAIESRASTAVDD